MDTERGNAQDFAGATVTLGDSIDERAGLTGVWRVEIFDADGVLQWDETLENLITTQGKNDMLSIYTLGTFAPIFASAFTGATSPSAAATYLAPVVTEVTPAQLAARVSLTWGAASAGAIVGTAALNITANATLTGIMAMKGASGIATPGNTAAAGGVLLSEGALGTAQVISTTGTVNLSYTLSV
jgi:hypothetical protein